MEKSIDRTKIDHIKLVSYITGFICSLIFTAAAFTLAQTQTFSGNALVAVLVILAIAQAIIQLIFFLHLNRGWGLVILISTTVIMLILVTGSLWIMANLNYNMTPQIMQQILLKNEGITQ